MKQLANSIQTGIKYFIFQKILISHFGESFDAAKLPEIYHGKVLCFNLHQLFGVDGNAENTKFGAADSAVI